MKSISSNFLSSILDASEDAIWAIDKDYCLQFANRSFQKATKAFSGVELVLGQFVLDNSIFPKQHLVFWKKNYDKCLKGEFFKIESEVAFEGTTYFNENSISPLHDDLGNIIGVTVFAHNVTKQKIAETEVQQTKQKFEYYLDNINSYIYIKGLDSKYKFINKKCEEQFKITRAEIAKIENPDYIFFSKDDAEKVLSHDKLVLENLEAIEFEEILNINHKEDHYFYTLKFPLNDENGNITGICGFSHDITKIKNTEIALKDSETKFKAIFDILEVGLNITNENGDIIDCNSSAEKLLGLTKEEQLSRNYASKEWKIIRPDYTPMPTNEFASVRAMNENKAVLNIPMGILKKESSITWISVSASPKFKYQVQHI